MERIWGSLRSATGCPVGEIWWVWDDGLSASGLLTADGVPTGLSLRDIAGGPDPFPIMVKTLHPADTLSLQVHPGLAGAGPCKAESWIFLHADPGAFAVLGLEPGVTPEEFSLAVSAGRPEPLLRKRPVRAGDIVHIPPGIVHCLCGGVEVLEFQQNCDITYRIWDWGRLGADGKPREVHLELALASIDFSSGTSGSGEEAGCGGFGYSLRESPPGGVFMPASSLLFRPGRGRDSSSASCLVADGSGGWTGPDSAGWLVMPANERR